ncbi:actin-related protein 2/3 complex subunit 2B isoform X2 [Momordica charantia]|uniref:Arp2/3 complex 34 kDa subunit n=1 Tax=Momordica charantia TaxID=3673 RepID=A0A6J1DKT8_MOMCH|nr:actin-related protein 2/3 complex subunit 2B isoform X2 [Momordica charantia]
MVMGRLLQLLPNFEWRWSLEFTHSVIISSKKKGATYVWSSFFSFSMKESGREGVWICEDGILSESFTSFEGNPPQTVQFSVSDPQNIYLSISTPLLSQGALLSDGLSSHTVEMVKQICSHVVEIVEPAREGYQLTLKIDFAQILHGKESEKIITEIAAVQAVILSSQLKEMLRNVNSQALFHETCRPIKLVYHPREPFFVIKQAQKILVIFPIRFKESTDVIIATAFFRELMDVGSSEKWAKAPPCCWSPIPPPELRGEPLEELSTNGGFVTFDISLRHVEGKRLDKTVWSLLNFNAYVKYHVKTTRGFIQRRMRKRLEGLVEILYQKGSDNVLLNKGQGIIYMKKLVAKTKHLKQKCRNLSKKIKRFRFRIKIPGFARFRRRWLKFPKFSSSIGYTRLK